MWAEDEDDDEDITEEVEEVEDIDKIEDEGVSEWIDEEEAVVRGIEAEVEVEADI